MYGVQLSKQKIFTKECMNKVSLRNCAVFSLILHGDKYDRPYFQLYHRIQMHWRASISQVYDVLQWTADRQQIVQAVHCTNVKVYISYVRLLYHTSHSRRETVFLSTFIIMRICVGPPSQKNKKINKQKTFEEDDIP